MKIFVAVGTQLAFDRLIRSVDEWAAVHPEWETFAQTAGGRHRPRHMRWADFLSPRAFEACSRRAEVLVTHAGTGSILTALGLRKPIVVVPRRARYREHRNDHQLATADRLQHLPGVTVAWDTSELRWYLDRLHELPAPTGELASFAPAPLLEAVSDFVHRVGPPQRGRGPFRRAAAPHPRRVTGLR